MTRDNDKKAERRGTVDEAEYFPEPSEGSSEEGEDTDEGNGEVNAEGSSDEGAQSVRVVSETELKQDAHVLLCVFPFHMWPAVLKGDTLCVSERDLMAGFWEERNGENMGEFGEW